MYYDPSQEEQQTSVFPALTDHIKPPAEQLYILQNRNHMININYENSQNISLKLNFISVTALTMTFLNVLDNKRTSCLTFTNLVKVQNNKQKF